MKRNLITAMAIVLMPLMAQAKLKVVTTTTDLADLARQVGGGHVEVRSVMKGPENLHNVMAKPTEMVKLSKADVFVHSGLDAEPWRDNLLKGSRNPRIMPGKPGNVDASATVPLRDTPAGKIDRSMGDVHAYGNPHYHLHPANVQRMAATLAHALGELDPVHADEYRANAKRVVNEIADLHADLKQKLAPFDGLKVATYHAAWDYFTDAFGLHVVATIEPKPAITPSPAELRNVIRKLKEQNVKIVIVETYNSYDQAKAVADAAGAKVIVLPDHVKGLGAVQTYQDLFRYNVEKIIEAAQ